MKNKKTKKLSRISNNKIKRSKNKRSKIKRSKNKRSKIKKSKIKRSKIKSFKIKRSKIKRSKNKKGGGEDKELQHLKRLKSVYKDAKRDYKGNPSDKQLEKAYNYSKSKYIDFKKAHLDRHHHHHQQAKISSTAPATGQDATAVSVADRSWDPITGVIELSSPPSAFGKNYAEHHIDDIKIGLKDDQRRIKIYDQKVKWEKKKQKKKKPQISNYLESRHNKLKGILKQIEDMFENGFLHYNKELGLHNAKLVLEGSFEVLEGLIAEFNGQVDKIPD